MTERSRRLNERWTKFGCDIDLSGLFFDGERSNVVEYLTDRGWRVTARKRRDLFGDYGLEFHDDADTAQLRNITAVTATLS